MKILPQTTGFLREISVLAGLTALLAQPALAQTLDREVYDQDAAARVRAHSATLEQDMARISQDQDIVAMDRARLERDRSDFHWWALTADTERLRQDKLQLDRDGDIYARDGGPYDYRFDE
jgi:hypothetical protein